jgi:hypothetical protein
MASPASAPVTETKPKSTFTENFNKWVQSIGIIVAALWGAYTFVYKEIAVPKSAPVNISINLQLRKLSTAKPKKALVAMEMRVSASNPSSRRIYLLQNKWMVWGYTANPKKPEDPDCFYARTADLMNDQLGQFSERHASWSTRNIVAGGSLFDDDKLSPNETITRTIIFYVPPDQYDSVRAEALIPTSEVENRLKVQWRSGKGTEDTMLTIYLVGDHGQLEPTKIDERGRPNDERVKGLGYQLSGTSTEISLWE